MLQGILRPCTSRTSHPPGWKRQLYGSRDGRRYNRKQVPSSTSVTRRSALPKLNCFGNVFAMIQDTSPVALKMRGFKTDQVFLMVSDPFRRAVIRSLASGEMKVASDIGWAGGIRRHNKLKHLAVLCKAGILIQKDNPKDARAPFFALSPRVNVRKEVNGLVADFGCCRLPILLT